MFEDQDEVDDADGSQDGALLRRRSGVRDERGHLVRRSGGASDQPSDGLEALPEPQHPLGLGVAPQEGECQRKYAN